MEMLREQPGLPHTGSGTVTVWAQSLYCILILIVYVKTAINIDNEPARSAS